MKKIIAAFDGLNFSKSTLDYTLAMARYCDAHVVGVFLEDFTYHSYMLSEVLDHGELSYKKMDMLNHKDQETRDLSVMLFEQACQNAGLNYSVHRDKNIAIQDLLHESIYSDLLIIDRKEKFKRVSETVPTNYISELLADIQCPVLVVPDKFETFNKIVILYDGQPSSVHAVKMFSYTLPALHYIPVEVLSIKSEKDSLHLPENKLIKEFMKRHYPEARYVVMKGDAEDKIISYLQPFNEGVLVVCGAYRRNLVSRWFKPSMADHLMEKLNSPLFIAHK